MAFRFRAAFYPIIDATAARRRPPVELAEAVLRGGVRLLQLRAKEASTRQFVELAAAIQALAARFGADLIVNDRLDVALAAGAAGVHLGQEDLPETEARRLLGPGRIIGVSTHSIEEVSMATRLGVADYLGFGPIYETTSKKRPDPVQGIEGLRLARAATTMPIAAIGGITRAHAAEVLASGADTVAMIQEIAAADDPEGLTAAMLQALPAP